jgi:hypothetical protein
MEANQEKVETKMEACLEGMEVETFGAPTTSDRLWYTGTHGKGGPGTILYDGPLKDRRSRRAIGRSRNATMA